MVSTRYILILLGLVLSLIVPVFGTDLTGYNGYITPKFGASIFGDYTYRSDYIDWMPQVPSFESNGGYYNIYNVGDIVNFQIHINTTKSGQLYLYIYHYSGGVLQQEKYLVEDLSSYNQWVSYEVEIKDNWEGHIYSQWVLYSGSQSYHSYEYLFFSKYALNSDWKYERTVDISSTEKLKDGIAQITINDSEFYNHSNIIYVSDDKNNNYVGTLGDLVFVNPDQTKAYPYFINKYKGGYYNYSRESSNNTIIDLWINEDLNDISLKMYYGLNPSKYSYPYIFGRTDSVFGDTRGDTPNNPFTVHQIFADWRWNSSFTPFDYSGGIYNRGSYLDSGDITNIPYNRIDEFYFRIMIGGGLVIIKTMFADNSSQFIDEEYYDEEITLYNSSGGSKGYDFGTGVNNYDGHYIYNGTHRVLNLSGTVLSIPEANNYLYMNENHLDSDYRDRIYYFYELPDNTVSYNISNETRTKYALINFISLYEIDTNLNDIYVGGIFETDTAGTFLCSDINNNTIDYIDIPEPLGTTSYNIIFPYLIENQTEFLNISNFTYYCKYVADNGFIEQSENKTITFQDNKIYLSNVKPIYQNNYSSEYVLSSITSDLNYTGIDTNFIHYIYKINCDLVNEDGKCLNYDTGTANLFLNNSINNISTNYVYSGVNELDQNNWYYSFYIYRTNETYAGTPSYLFYVQAEEKALISFPVDDYLDWNDTELTNNTEFMNNKFWENPLNWFSSFIFQNFIITQIKDERTLEIFRYTFLIFWSYLFILLVIWMAFLFQFREHYESVKIASIGTMPFFFLFAYLGWLGINIVALMVLLISIGVLYIWKR